MSVPDPLTIFYIQNRIDFIRWFFLCRLVWSCKYVVFQFVSMWVTLILEYWTKDFCGYIHVLLYRFFFLVMSFLGFWGFFLRASLLAQSIKNLPAVQETWVRSLGWEGPLETEMATHSSILAWKISWTQEPGGLQSMGSQRVGHDWATNINTLHFLVFASGRLLDS